LYIVQRQKRVFYLVFFYCGKHGVFCKFTFFGMQKRIHFRTDMEHNICRPVNDSDVSMGYQFCKNITFILYIIYKIMMFTLSAGNNCILFNGKNVFFIWYFFIVGNTESSANLRFPIKDVPTNFSGHFHTLSLQKYPVCVILSFHPGGHIHCWIPYILGALQNTVWRYSIWNFKLHTLVHRYVN
jgi:hypothetical protein